MRTTAGVPFLEGVQWPTVHSHFRLQFTITLMQQADQKAVAKFGFGTAFPSHSTYILFNILKPVSGTWVSDFFHSWNGGKIKYYRAWNPAKTM